MDRDPSRRRRRKRCASPRARTQPPRRALARVALVALGLTSCQLLGERLGETILAEGYELSFERTADLIPPDGLRVTSTEDRQIALAWNPVLVGDIAGYAITRSQAPDGSYPLIGQTVSRFGTVFTDRGDPIQGLGDGQTYHYRIHPYDRAGRVSRSHAYLRATTEPRPDVPTGLQAYSNLPRKVVLVWDPSDRRSTTGYVIERSPTGSGPWERIGASDGRLNSVYEDPVPGDLRVLYYRIAARNRFGGESDVTKPQRAVTKAEPLPPIGLRVRARALGRIDLAWDPNVEPDVARYEIWRSRRDEAGWIAPERIGEVEGLETEFADPGVGCGEPVRYQLRSIDADGLVSALSEVLEVRGSDIALEFEPPRTLRWDGERTRSWPGARILLVRRLLPDRELGVVRGGASLDLGELGPGSHRVRVLPAAPDPRPERVCEVVVNLSAAE